MTFCRSTRRGPSERKPHIEQRIAANTVRRDELFKGYEDRGLVADNEDRRLFEDVQRAKEIMTASRTRAIELAHQGKAEESQKLQQEAVIPAYEKYLKAIDLTVDYKAKLGQSAADAGKASALFSVRLIGAALALALLLAILLAWQVIRSTNRALKRPHGQSRPGGAPDRLGSSAGIDGEPEPRFRR